MTRSLALSIICILSVSVGFSQGPAAATNAKEPVQMTDAMVVKMVLDKVSPDLIIMEISNSTPKFALDDGSVNYMKGKGVTDDILKAMKDKMLSATTTGTTPALATVPDTDSPSQSNLLPSSKPSGMVLSAPKSNQPRVFLGSASHGNNVNSRRDQSMEMSKDFEKDCPGVRITLNQQMADYTVLLNHIEIGLIVRDNQFQVADRNGDLIAKTKEGGSIRSGMKKVCGLILADWNKAR